jgi:hypothetical protein
MIYQLYPNAKTNSIPYSKYYSTICLDCLDSTCFPQLKMEYSAMIHLWKNQLDNDEWIGFTSYRQKNKSSFILSENNYINTISLLNDYDILCFLFLNFSISLSEQAEHHHKQINKNLEILFNRYYKETIPNSFFVENCGCFANYWIMSKQNFNEFMNWSYPKVKTIIDLSKTNRYFKINKHQSNSGYIIERLFIIWYMQFQKNIFPLFYQHRHK